MTQVVRQLGVGKHATVFEGRTDVGRRVAIKKLNQQVQQNGPKRQRILQAAETWARLEHRGLVGFLDMNREQGSIIMEFMERNLATFLRAPLDPAMVRSLLHDCLQALDYLHQQGNWLHANLKPTNVFIDSEGRGRISDGLGISLSSPGALPAPTTRKYIAPEQAQGSGERTGPGMDLYCLGFIALEMLVGESLGKRFTGVGDRSHDDDLAWFRWHAAPDKNPSASDLSPACPRPLAMVIDRLLLKNPLDRYHSAQQALADLSKTDSAEPVANLRAREPSRTEPQPLDISVGDILERPAHGIVLFVASGPNAGQMVGCDDDAFNIGYDADCRLRFQPDQYPHSTAKVLIRRNAQGWTAARQAGRLVLLNDRVLDGEETLRSADILRLSDRGPDVQFILQSGGPSIQQLAREYLPKGVVRGRDPVEPKGRGAVEAGRAPSPEPRVVSGRPESASAPGMAPAPPSPPTPPVPSRTLPSPAPPAPPAPTLRPPKPLPPTPGPTDPAEGFAVNADLERRPFWLFQPQSWSKSTTNWIVGIVASLIGLILFLIVPAGREQPPPEKNPLRDSAPIDPRPPDAEAAAPAVEVR